MGSIEQNWRNFLDKGDEESFSIIYNNYVDDLYSYGISMGFREESCKDAIQDVFIKLYVSKNRLSHIDNIAGYIFRSLKNRLIDIERKDFGKDSIETIEDRFTLEVTVLDNIIDSETASILKNKVNQLLKNITKNQREAVYLKYVIGLQHKEIADILNIREDSARKLLFRAMEKLRKLAYDDGDILLILFVLSLLQQL